MENAVLVVYAPCLAPMITQRTGTNVQKRNHRHRHRCDGTRTRSTGIQVILSYKEHFSESSTHESVTKGSSNSPSRRPSKSIETGVSKRYMPCPQWHC